MFKYLYKGEKILFNFLKVFYFKISQFNIDFDKFDKIAVYLIYLFLVKVCAFPEMSRLSSTRA